MDAKVLYILHYFYFLCWQPLLSFSHPLPLFRRRSAAAGQEKEEEEEEGRDLVVVLLLLH